MAALAAPAALFGLAGKDMAGWTASAAFAGCIQVGLDEDGPVAGALARAASLAATAAAEAAAEKVVSAPAGRCAGNMCFC